MNEGGGRTMRFIPYIGGKHRVAKKIAELLHAPGIDCLVDVFGGSGAVVMNAGFEKRVYNDSSGDLVNLFQTIADPEQRREFLRRMRWIPPSRQIYEQYREKYFQSGFSFSFLDCPMERAMMTYFRHQFAFGGKVRSGRFSVGITGRRLIKEVSRYRNRLRQVVEIGNFFQNTMIEHLDFRDCISMYGGRSNCVLYIDPPYVGTEDYYGEPFSKMEHVFLAHLLK